MTIKPTMKTTEKLLFQHKAFVIFASVAATALSFISLACSWCIHNLSSFFTLPHHVRKIDLWWSLCTLFLLAYQVRITVGDSGVCYTFCPLFVEHTSLFFFYSSTPCPEDVSLMEFMYLVFTRVPGENYRRRFRCLLYCVFFVCRALFLPFACWVMCGSGRLATVEISCACTSVTMSVYHLF